MNTILILIDSTNVPWLSKEQQQQYQHKIEQIAPDMQAVFMPKEKLTKEDIRNAQVIMGWSGLAKEVCEETDTPLRWVQSWSAGVDKMPMQLFAQKKVILTSASGIHSNQLSETILGLMLGLSRGFGIAAKGQAQHKWLHNQGSSYALGELHEKTVGILGAGKMGSVLAGLCKAFDCTVLGLSRSGGVKPGFDVMYKEEDMDGLLAKADYVVNLLPLTAQTRGIINAQKFAVMKKGAYYLGVGRGPTTNTADLAEALSNGQLAGAGLDVTDPEPLPEESPLWDMPNVIILPHMGGFSARYTQRLMDLFIENLQSYVKTGKPARNIIDFKQQY